MGIYEYIGYILIDLFTDINSTTVTVTGVTVIVVSECVTLQ